MMVGEGGGKVGRFFMQDLLDQWKNLLVVFEEYLYAGMNYHGDPEMP